MRIRYATFVYGLSVAFAVCSVASAAPKAPPSGKPVRQLTPPPPAELTSNPELMFVPLATPCRIFDTSRTTAFATGEKRTFFINSGDFNYKKQGARTSEGCGVPASASGVAISLTSSSSGANGSLSAAPLGGAATTTALSFSPGRNATAGVSLGVNSNRIVLQANGGSTNVAGDVTGYFMPQIQAYVFDNGSLFSGTPRVLSSENLAAGSYRIVVDREVFTCAVAVTAASPGYFASAYGDTGNTIVVQIFTVSGGNLVNANSPFNVVAHC